MDLITCEPLEPRRLLSGTDAAITDDLVIIQADIQRIHFDQAQLRVVTTADQLTEKITTTDDRNRIREDQKELRFDEHRNLGNVLADLKQLEADEGTLASDIRNLTGTARTDRDAVLAQIATDKETLRIDRHQLSVDRHPPKAAAPAKSQPLKPK